MSSRRGRRSDGPDLQALLGRVDHLRRRLDGGEAVTLGEVDRRVLEQLDPGSELLEVAAWGEAGAPVVPVDTAERTPVVDTVLAIRRLPEPKGFVELSPVGEGPLLAPRVGLYRFSLPRQGIVGYMVEEPDGQGMHRFVLRSHASLADALVRQLQEEPATLAPGTPHEWSVRLSLWAARRNRVVHVDLFGMRIEAAAGIGWFTLVEDRRKDMGEEPLDRFRRRVLAALEQPLGLT